MPRRGKARKSSKRRHKVNIEDLVTFTVVKHLQGWTEAPAFNKARKFDSNDFRTYYLEESHRWANSAERYNARQEEIQQREYQAVQKFSLPPPTPYPEGHRVWIGPQLQQRNLSPSDQARRSASSGYRQRHRRRGGSSD